MGEQRTGQSSPASIEGVRGGKKHSKQSKKCSVEKLSGNPTDSLCPVEVRQGDTFGEGTILSAPCFVPTVNLHPALEAGGLGSNPGFALNLLCDLGPVDGLL